MNSAQNASISPKLTPNMGLKHRNTFGFEVYAEQAYEITEAEQLPAVVADIQRENLSWRVLGGGSNVILPSALPGVTLLINIPGQEILSSDESNTFIAVGAGINWHEFVEWTLEQNVPGLENLALIPGTVGAAPIQNIGAYGVEIADYIDSIEAFDTRTHAFVTLSKVACHFAYRDSYFKQYPQQYIVTKVVFKIPQNWVPRIHYADLAKQFLDCKEDVSAQDIFKAVCAIRTHKLPDPKVIGNVGSFFQNPVVASRKFEALREQFPEIVSYPDQADKRKLAAGWLIDQCGFKGKTVGPVGVYQNQALVLVNHGGGTAKDILALAQSIQDEVRNVFGVDLEIEPNIL
jgi:UDP-N-acetylmuramate dehydrogenase